MSSVWTNGVFDLLHPGHLASLSFAHNLGDRLYVGLNTDLAVKILKGSTRPIQCWQDRCIALLNTGLVDYVVPIGIDPSPELAELLPDIMVKGSDYSEENILGRQYCGRVVLAPYLPGYSTTAIIAERGR